MQPTDETMPDASPGGVLLIADDAVAAGEIARAMASMAAREPVRIAFADAAAALTTDGGIEAILIDTGGVDAVAALEVLERVDAVARARWIPVIASFPLAHLDLVTARLGAARTQFLCEPSMVERCAAIALAMPRTTALRESEREVGERRLRELHAEVSRIAETLARLAGEGGADAAAVRDRTNSFAAQPAPVAHGAIDVADIRAAIRTRRLREQFFDRELFADPAWDMLLDLFAARLDGVRVSVSSLCIAAAVPPTTALRWIATMREAGLLERQDDPSDRRRTFIGLTVKAVAGMEAYASAARRAGLGIA